MKKIFTSLLILLTLGACSTNEPVKFTELYPFNPLTYVAYRTTPLTIDGNIEKEEWQKAPWTEDFADIRGKEYDPQPKYRTRAKMLWDDNYLYIAAELEEPHIWANVTQRDETIYWDNDFEVFIDPDGDAHNYVEFEMNALNTVWDLFFFRPYYSGGPYKVEWDMKGLKTAVKIFGTLNDPSDIDQKWTVELAFPLKEISDTTIFEDRVLSSANHWRINFSRVNWLAMEIQDGKYVKEKGKEGFGHEENWVWNPTGRVDMHRPEQWGFLQFSDIKVGEGTEEFKWNPDEDIKWGLRTLFYRQDEIRKQNEDKDSNDKNHYATSIEELQPETIDTRGVIFKPVLYPEKDKYKISAPSADGKSKWTITNDGKVYQEAI